MFGKLKKTLRPCIYTFFFVPLQPNMDYKIALYRVRTWLRHQLTAWNTGGEGVHSPYLFEWVRMVMSDKHSYYKWHEIENLRQGLLKDKRELEFVDYGKKRTEDGEVKIDRRRVCDIARGSLARKDYAQMLARLVCWLGEKKAENGKQEGEGGLTIVELGTSFGITTSYLAAMDSRNRVVTFEGCPGVAEIAQANWAKLQLENIECVVGNIRDLSLFDFRCATEPIGQVGKKVDLFYIDASHTYVSTRAFFNVGASMAHEKTVVVIDDIHHSPEMERAWTDICADERVTSTIDLYQMGLVFFDKHYWRRNYKMRL